MFNSIAYDNDYNRKIAQRFNELNSKNQNPEPDNFFKFNIGLYGEKMVGGNRNIGVIRQIGGSRPYLNEGVYDRDQKQKHKIVPGTNASMIPYYHQYELDKIDNNLSDFQGGNIFKKAWKGIKKAVKNPVVKDIITKGLDYGAPIVGRQIGQFIGNPELGEDAVNFARKKLKEKTGYGNKYQLYMNKNMSGGMCCPKKGKGVKSGGGGPVSGGGVKSGGGGPVSGGGVKSGGAKTKRAELVKKIMREKKLSLPQASKYIKENNLY